MFHSPGRNCMNMIFQGATFWVEAEALRSWLRQSVQFQKCFSFGFQIIRTQNLLSSEIPNELVRLSCILNCYAVTV
jgi:hypothetical protein